MVVGAFPIAKLAVLLVKQVSKPIANACKERAKNHPFFRTYVCMPPAQFYNWCEVKAKMWVLNLGKPVNIPVLSQEMAIELGANLLGEGVIFVIGAALLIFEYSRQANKESIKEAKRMEEFQNLTDTIKDLYFNVQKQETKIRELERIVLASNSRNPQVPIKMPSEQPKGPTSPPAPPSSSGSTEINNPNHCPEDPSVHPQTQNIVGTPYPDRGLIFKSLNYIQMDVFSLQLFENIPSSSHPKERERTQRIPADHHQTACLTNTLFMIENNFKSLF